MSRTARFTCIGMLLLILGSIGMPVYAMSGACVGMSCHKNRADRVGEPMDHKCCGTSVCADAPEATSAPTVTVTPVQQVAVLTFVATVPMAADASRRTAVVAHSPPLDTGSRLALLSTLLI